MSYLYRSLKELVELDDRVRGLGVFIAYTASWGPPSLSGSLNADVESLVDYLKSRYELEILKNDLVVRAYRDFFWRVPQATHQGQGSIPRRRKHNSKECQRRGPLPNKPSEQLRS